MYFLKYLAYNVLEMEACMINKQSVWFVTLFSLILVLSIYYVTMSDNSLKGIIESNSSTESTAVNSEIKESSILVSLRVEDDESVLKETENYQSILLDIKKTSDEKNNAYNSLLSISEARSLEEKLEKNIKETLKLDSFVKVKDDTVSVTLVSKEQTNSLANNVIRLVNENSKKEVYVTVKFINS